MKNFKRTLALVLAVIMIAGMFASVSAASVKWYTNAVRYIEGVGIATIGNTAEDKITRDEFVLWIAKLESGVLNDAYWSAAIETPFTDITEENNQTAIWYSARRGLIEGNGDGTFSPDKNLTFAEAAAVIVRLMRYTSKVEGDAEDWAWANMEVANEYCKAFTNEFLSKVGGSVYDYDYELTKGEVAYLLATIMNSVVIENGAQIIETAYKTTYKSLTIDGHNLGERFIGKEGAYGVSGNTYMVSAIAFDEEDGTVVGNVVLTPISAKTGATEITLSASDFTKLVRTSLGLAADLAEDEVQIRVVDTVKLGNLVDVALKANNSIASLKVHTGSKVVDTHVVMDSMLGLDYNGYGIANWTADSIVSGASNSNEYRDAIINSKWSSALLFTWDGNKIVFEGQKYDVTSSSFKVYQEVNGVLELVADRTTVKSLVPDVATGEVTVIFNDENLDGKYDALVILDDYTSDFYLEFIDNKTVNDLYYAEGYSIDATKASGKLQLLVLAQGRFGHYAIEDLDKDSSVKDEYADGDINGEIGDYGRNYMNPYAVLDLATISSGIIEESTLKTFNGNETYYVVTVKNAAGAREKIYIPFSTATETAPKFSYTINGVEKSFDTANAGWKVDEKLAFVNEIPSITGIETVDADTNKYAAQAAKLVGRYISYVVNNGKVVYCVEGTTATAEAGYLLNVAATDVANMYNVTVLNVNANGKAADVKIYSVNATASVMMNSNYDAITSIFNKNNIHADADLYNIESTKDIIGAKETIEADALISTTESANEYGDNLYAVSVHSNGTFSYIVVEDSIKNISFTDYTDDVKLSSDPVRLDKVGDADDVLVYDTTNDNFVVAGGKLYYAIQDNTGLAGSAASTIVVTRTYESEFYRDPEYFYDKETDKWYLCVATETVTLTYSFGADSTNVTKSNYTTISDSALKEVLAGGVGSWINVVIDATGKKVLAYAKYSATPDNTYSDGATVYLKGVEVSDSTNGTAVTDSKYCVPAEVKADADGNLYVAYDFRGVDRTYAIKVANKTDNITVDGVKVDNNGKGYYSFANAVVTEATVVTDTKKKTSGNVVRDSDLVDEVRTIVDAESSISNVSFTAMDKSESGYIPGTYWFSLNDSETLYFNGKKASDTVDAYAPVTKAVYDELKNAGFEVATSAIKFRTNANTEIVLLTPTANGYAVKVMTPAEAATKNLIISHYSFVVPAQLEEVPAYNKYNNYNNKLDAIVLVGQEALVANTTTPDTDDGKTVGANEYLVYVPADTETILVAPEGSKTIKVASTKSVYAIPSGTEIGSIYYEYDVYTGAEAAKINTVINSGWYVVTETGKIIEKIVGFEDTTVNKTNGTYANNAHVSVVGDKVVATVYTKSNDAETSTVLATYDLSTVTFLYKDVDGTLKVVDDKDAKFASSATFAIEMKTAKAAVETAYDKMINAAANKKAAKVADYEAAVAAYNELLAANIDKFFNGDILDTFKATVDTETSIQGNGEYTTTIYNVDGQVFVILNTWELVDLETGKAVDEDTEYYIAVVNSAFN